MQPAQRLWRDPGLWKVGNLVTDKRGALLGHERTLAFAVALWSLLCSRALCRLCSVCVWMLCRVSRVSVWHPRFGEEGDGCSLQGLRREMLKTSLWKSPHGRIVRLLSQVTDSFVYWLPGFSQWFWLREFLACMKFPSQPTSQAPASVASSTWHRHFITCIATSVTTAGNIAAFSASRYCKLVGSGYKDIWSPVFPTSNKPDSGQLLLLLSFRQNLTEDLRKNGLLMEEVQMITI